MENDFYLFEWINTFPLPYGCQSFDQLSDGKIILSMLHEIAPESFRLDIIQDVSSSNWMLAESNLNILLRVLQGYYANSLQRNLDIRGINVENIAKYGSRDDLMVLLEAVAGACVLCDNSDNFVRSMFSLSDGAQAVLKPLIENGLARSSLISSNEAADEFPDIAENSEDSILREENRQLRLARDSLQSRVYELESTVQHHQGDIVRLSQELSLYANGQMAASNHHHGESSSSSTESLRVMEMQLSDLSRDFDMKSIELEDTKHKLDEVLSQQDATAEMLMKLTVENQQLVDEIEVLRETSEKLSKAESLIEKYQARLEEIPNLKNQNKVLYEKLDQYLDKIHEFESNAKATSVLQKLVEQYKDKAVELEREKFEAFSSLEIKKSENQRLNDDLERLESSKNMLESELIALKKQNQELMDSKQSSSHAEMSSSFESMTDLRIRCHELEMKLQALESAENGVSDSSLNENIVLLKARLEDLERVKTERESTIVEKDKQLSKLQSELDKTRKANTTSSQDMSKQHEMTIKMLEDKIKGLETAANDANQKASKMEDFGKNVLEKLKEFQSRNVMEKKEMLKKINEAEEKYRILEETARKEEHLLTSALYNFGSMLMGKNIRGQMMESNNTQMAFANVARRKL